MKIKFLFILSCLIFFNTQLIGQVVIPFHNQNSILTADNRCFKFSENKMRNISMSFQLDELSGGEEKSVAKAFLLSLVLPGAGEFYMGNKSRGTFFLSMEIIAWGGLLANSLYSDHLKNEYYTYAAQHAGVQKSGKDKQYWIDIGKYDDIYTLNEQRRRERYFDLIYEENQQNYWMWDSRANRYTYDNKRLRANGIADQDVYFYLAIILNHLSSAINSLGLARKHNRNLQASKSWHLHFDSYRVADNSNYYGVKLTAHF